MHNRTLLSGLLNWVGLNWVGSPTEECQNTNGPKHLVSGGFSSDEQKAAAVLGSMLELLPCQTALKSWI